MSGRPHIRPDSRPQAPQNSKPPHAGRFPKGRSGNPKGRPRGSGKHAERYSAFEVLLDKTLTVTIAGKAREISMEEALTQRTFKDALAGKGMSVREIVKWIIKRETWFRKHLSRDPSPPKITRLISPDPDNADAALVLLGIAAPNPARAGFSSERAQLILEPWAVQLALRRTSGGASLTDRDRDDVQRCTRDAHTLF
jgi:hypothetical protein